MSAAMIFLVTTLTVYAVLLGLYWGLTAVLDCVWARSDRLREFVERMWNR